MAEEKLIGRIAVPKPPGGQETRMVQAPDGTFVQVPVVKFDGHSFLLHDLGQMLPYFDMASRARRGDMVAAELITVAGLTIRDADGKPYWPLPIVPPPSPLLHGVQVNPG